MQEETSSVISAVIPTWNRPQSLVRALNSLARQERRPDEVIIVDASDHAFDTSSATRLTDLLHITVLRSHPDLCHQRNLGIGAAQGRYVLLCDDDVEMPPDYVRRMVGHLDEDPDRGAVTGVFRDKTPGGALAPGFPAPAPLRLLFSFVFQLTVWGDVEALNPAGFQRPVLEAMKRWYRRRGNTWSLAGWPLVTQVRAPSIETAIYSLGGALVRRDWLLASPFDERLGSHGIGENYGVAIGFPKCPGITVLTDIDLTHHRAPEGRLAPHLVYYDRLMALHHFTRDDPRFGRLVSAFLVWSLVGNACLFLARRERQLLRATLRAIACILSGGEALERSRGTALIDASSAAP